MPDTSAPAPAEAQQPAGTPQTADPVQASKGSAKPAKAAPAPSRAAGNVKAEGIAAIIRNGLSNGPISQSNSTWDHLLTRLPEIVAAITALIKEA